MLPPLPPLLGRGGLLLPLSLYLDLSKTQDNVHGRSQGGHKAEHRAGHRAGTWQGTEQGTEKGTRKVPE